MHGENGQAARIPSTASTKSGPARFMVVSTQRSGSTWVVDMLNSHPSVVCYGPLFLPGRKGSPPAGAQDRTYFTVHVNEVNPGVRRYRVPELAWRFLDDLYRPRSDRPAIGFGYQYSHFRIHPWVLLYARAKGIRIVHLIRRNKFEHVLSKASAKARGEYHARPGDPLFTPPIHLETARLVRWMREEEGKVRWGRRALRLLGLPVLEVYYEDLASDQAAFANVLEFLDVEPRTDLLRTSFQRWSAGMTYEQRISNYADVRATLEGTRFADLLS